MKRTFAEAGILILVLLVCGVTVDGQEEKPEEKAEQSNTVQSWSLEFRADTPELYIHRDEQGNRTRYLYITYLLRNNFGRKVPLGLNFVLQADRKTYYPASANPDVEHEIIKREENLRGFSKGVRKIKIKNLKKQGRYLNVDDLNRGFYLRHIAGEGIREHEIRPLSIRSLETKNGSNESNGRIPYQVMFREGPSDRQGKPYERRLTDHPAEIKGLLLFKGIDLDTRELTLKVGNLIDPLVRVEKVDVPDTKKFRFEPKTLHLNWTWNVPRNRKQHIGPEFTGRHMEQERFGPVATRDTLRKLIDFLSMDPEEGSTQEAADLEHTLRGTALSTLRELTGNSFGYDPSVPPSENREAIDAWNRWWGRNKHDLLYILARPEQDGRDPDLFYTYPQPRYIVVKRRVDVAGAGSPQDAFGAFKSAWNEQRWQDVMNKLVIEQREKATLRDLFSMLGYQAEIGIAQNYKETDRPNRRVVSFKHGETTKQLQLEQDQGEWFLRVPAENRGK